MCKAVVVGSLNLDTSITLERCPSPGRPSPPREFPSIKGERAPTRPLPWGGWAALCHGGRRGPGCRRGHLAGKPPGGGGGLLLRGPPGGAHRPGLHHRGQRRGKTPSSFWRGPIPPFPRRMWKSSAPCWRRRTVWCSSWKSPWRPWPPRPSWRAPWGRWSSWTRPPPLAPCPGSCWPCAITSSPTRQSWPCSPGCPPPQWSSARQPHAGCWPRGWARCWCLWGPKGPWP